MTSAADPRVRREDRGGAGRRSSGTAGPAPGLWLLLPILLLQTLPGCAAEEQRAAAEPVRLVGRTMGTGWLALLPPDEAERAGGEEAVRSAIEEELLRVNARASTYDPASELSRFNASASLEPFAVSEELAELVDLAVEIGVRSGGAFDVTVGPVVNLWGFGPDGERRVPEPAALEAARARCGAEKLRVTVDPPRLRKASPGLYVDLSGIAKGWGVDRVGALLESLGARAWFVEIGGEIRARGEKAPGVPWRIGVEEPDGGDRAVHAVYPLHEGAVATSGDYRNVFAEAGRRYSHTIDPRSGRPVEHGLASATVVAGTCAEADAWATALMVLGPEAGYDLAVERGLAAFLLFREGGTLAERSTPAFEAFKKEGRLP